MTSCSACLDSKLLTFTLTFSLLVAKMTYLLLQLIKQDHLLPSLSSLSTKAIGRSKSHMGNKRRTFFSQLVQEARRFWWHLAACLPNNSRVIAAIRIVYLDRLLLPLRKHNLLACHPIPNVAMLHWQCQCTCPACGCVTATVSFSKPSAR